MRSVKDTSSVQRAAQHPSLIPSQAQTQPKQIKTTQSESIEPSFAMRRGPRPQNSDRTACIGPVTARKTKEMPQMKQQDKAQGQRGDVYEPACGKGKKEGAGSGSVQSCRGDKERRIVATEREGMAESVISTGLRKERMREVRDRIPVWASVKINSVARRVMRINAEQERRKRTKRITRITKPLRRAKSKRQMIKVIRNPYVPHVYVKKRTAESINR